MGEELTKEKVRWAIVHKAGPFNLFQSCLMLRFARDGANYTTRAVFDCYYNPEDESYVVIDYQPKR
jgi:hypothetical protein